MYLTMFIYDITVNYCYAIITIVYYNACFQNLCENDQCGVNFISLNTICEKKQERTLS